MSRNKPGRNVVDAARRGAHQHRDGAAAIERVDRLCRGLRRCYCATQTADEKNRRAARGTCAARSRQRSEQIAEAVPRLAHVQPLLNFPNPRCHRMYDWNLQVLLEHLDDIQRTPAGAEHVNRVSAFGGEEMPFDMSVDAMAR